MKKILVSLTIALLLLVVLVSIAYAATGVTDPGVLRDLAKVRQATAKYHDVNAALADGFIQTPQCIESPDGGMGIHFIHPARLMDPAVNILEPEILLYVETNSGMKLLGVEYWFSIGPPDTPVPNPAPPPPSFLAERLKVRWKPTSPDSLRTMTCMPGYGRGIPAESSPRSTRI